jgi:phosphoribosylformylglycinamidine synthase
MTAAAGVQRPKEFSVAGKGPKFGVVRFPGSNCDQDAYYALRDVFERQVEYLWHQETNLKGCDVVVLPGGFSYGDYLRTGAVARFAPIMEAVLDHAANGGFVIGICNGFQVLCEAHLLPGALVRNASLKFVCKFVTLRVENAATPFTAAYRSGQLLQIPVAHGEGRYVCDDDTLEQLKANGRIL